ncbi:hypothetical protein JD844_001385, partial [Phrynosoma platyrhinos]
DNMAAESIIRIPPYHYTHVLDQNSNVTRVEVGPKTYIRQDNESVTFTEAAYKVLLTVSKSKFLEVSFFPLLLFSQPRIIFPPVKMVMVPPRHYCIILNPVIRGADGTIQLDALGQVRLRHADLEIRLTQDPFPLYPGEELKQVRKSTYIPQKEVEVVQTIQATVIRPNQAIRLQARKECKDREGNKRVTGEEWLVKRDDEKVLRKPGDRWLIRGPLEYVPPTEVEVLEQRRSIPLAENEGIYVRDIKTGKVRAVIGHTYMLSQEEELWEKDLPSHVEDLLTSERNPVVDRSRDASDGSNPVYRDRTRAVSYRVPHNAAVQVYDYKERKSRVVFGPELVLLGPDEQFTVLSLSGGRPKRPHARRALCLLLGPDFCTDIIIIETADHARLQLQLAYNW